MTIVYILLGLLVLVCLLYALCLRCRRRKDWERFRKWRFAHRGFHDKPRIPENSIPAFRRAVQCGFGAELDVHLMKDGHLAVIHDASLLRTAGVDVQIEDLTAEDLKTTGWRARSTTSPCWRRCCPSSPARPRWWWS